MRPDRVWRTLAGMRATSLAILFVISVLAAGCSVGAHWVGDGVEAVDGSWIMGERACDDPGCTAAKDAARAAIGDPDGSTVVKASLADWTEAYDTGIGGGVIMRTKSPPVGITFFVVVLDRKDGTRQIVPISCSQQDGVAPAALWDHCGPDGMDHAYNRVGNEPWTQPGPNSL